MPLVQLRGEHYTIASLLWLLNSLKATLVADVIICESTFFPVNPKFFIQGFKIYEATGS